MKIVSHSSCRISAILKYLCPLTLVYVFSPSVFKQDQNFCGSLMTPCLKIWGSLTNLEGQNFFIPVPRFSGKTAEIPGRQKNNRELLMVALSNYENFY